MSQILDVADLGHRVTFDLLVNPFAILRAAIDATREDVAAAFDDGLSDGLAAESDLKEARRQLLAPKLRIQATVEFLPDAAESDRGTAIDALRHGKPLSDLIAIAKDLPSFSRTVFLSSIAQLRPSSGVLRYFALSRAEVDVAELSDIVSEIGARANIPRPKAEVVAEAIDVVTIRNADRLFSAYVDLGPAAADMRRCLEEGLPKATEGQMGAYSTLVDAYDRRTSGSAHALRRQIEDAAELIRSNPDDANALVAIISLLRDWDALTQPQQLLAQHKGRDDPGSRELFQFLRGLSLELANEKGAAASALEMTKVCLEVFGELPRAVQQLRGDADSLQGLVDQAGLKELQQFVETANQDLDPLVRDLNRGGFSQGAPGLAGRLYALLAQGLDATHGTSANEYAWGFVRVLALDINNELGEGGASEKLIAGLRSHPKFGDAPAQLRASIEADLQTLRSNELQARFKRALDKKDRNEARKILVDLISITTDPVEKQQYQRAISGIDSANSGRIAKFIIWGVIALAVVGYSISQSGGSNRSSSTTYRPPSTSVTVAPATPVATLDEVRPPVGTNVAFSRGNIRYCLYLSARLDAIGAEMSLEANSGVIAAFNREVDGYNARCASFQYYPDDLAAINREVTTKQSTLATEGRQLLQRWRAEN